MLAGTVDELHQFCQYGCQNLLRKILQKKGHDVFPHHLSNFRLCKPLIQHCLRQNRELCCVKQNLGCAIIVRTKCDMVNSQQVDCITNRLHHTFRCEVAYGTIPIANTYDATLRCNASQF